MLIKQEPESFIVDELYELEELKKNKKRPTKVQKPYSKLIFYPEKQSVSTALKL